jgi:hypothetical protein
MGIEPTQKNLHSNLETPSPIPVRCSPHFSWLRLKIASEVPIHVNDAPLAWHAFNNAGGDTLENPKSSYLRKLCRFKNGRRGAPHHSRARASSEFSARYHWHFAASDGSYFQVLEGDAEAIDSLYAKIALDKRHTNVVLIVREPIATRSFADWSMGYASVTSKDVAGIIGANDFFEKKTCFYELSAGRAKKLLAAFADGRWRASSAA